MGSVASATGTAHPAGASLRRGRPQVNRGFQSVAVVIGTCCPVLRGRAPAARSLNLLDLVERTTGARQSGRGTTGL